MKKQYMNVLVKIENHMGDIWWCIHIRIFGGLQSLSPYAPESGVVAMYLIYVYLMQTRSPLVSRDDNSTV